MSTHCEHGNTDANACPSCIDERREKTVFSDLTICKCGNIHGKSGNCPLCKLETTSAALLEALEAASAQIYTLTEGWTCPERDHGKDCVTARDTHNIQSQAIAAIAAAKGED